MSTQKFTYNIGSAVPDNLLVCFCNDTVCGLLYAVLAVSEKSWMPKINVERIFHIFGSEIYRFHCSRSLCFQLRFDFRAARFPALPFSFLRFGSSCFLLYFFNRFSGKRSASFSSLQSLALVRRYKNLQAVAALLTRIFVKYDGKDASKCVMRGLRGEALIWQ